MQCKMGHAPRPTSGGRICNCQQPCGRVCLASSTVACQAAVTRPRGRGSGCRIPLVNSGQRKAHLCRHQANDGSHKVPPVAQEPSTNPKQTPALLRVCGWVDSRLSQDSPSHTGHAHHTEPLNGRSCSCTSRGAAALLGTHKRHVCSRAAQQCLPLQA